MRLILILFFIWKFHIYLCTTYFQHPKTIILSFSCMISTKYSLPNEILKYALYCPVENVWLTMPKAIFTQFLVSPKCNCHDYIRKIGIEHLQSVIKVFQLLSCLVMANPVISKPELKSSFSKFNLNFYGPTGTLKIKAGSPTSSICQGAQITHGQFITKYQLESLIGQLNVKSCQSVVIVYWHNCLKAISNTTSKMIGK